jgi:hypothetical protein
MNSVTSDKTALLTATASTGLNAFIGIFAGLDINTFVAWMSAFVLIITNLRKVVWEIRRLAQIITADATTADNIMHEDFQKKDSEL